MPTTKRITIDLPAGKRGESLRKRLKKEASKGGYDQRSLNAMVLETGLETLKQEAQSS